MRPIGVASLASETSSIKPARDNSSAVVCKSATKLVSIASARIASSSGQSIIADTRSRSVLLGDARASGGKLRYLTLMVWILRNIVPNPPPLGPLLEEIPAPVCRLNLVGHDMPQGRFRHLIGVMCRFRAPVLERAAEPVRDITRPKIAHHFKHCHVA